MSDFFEYKVAVGTSYGVTASAFPGRVENVTLVSIDEAPVTDNLDSAMAVADAAVRLYQNLGQPSDAATVRVLQRPVTMVRGQWSSLREDD